MAKCYVRLWQKTQTTSLSAGEPQPLASDLLNSYIAVLIAAVLGFVLVGSALLGNLVLSPRQKTRNKGVTYECGMLPIGRCRAQVHIRYYLFAILFLIFDIEAVFLFPWAVTLRRRSASRRSGR